MRLRSPLKFRPSVLRGSSRRPSSRRAARASACSSISETLENGYFLTWVRLEALGWVSNWLVSVLQAAHSAAMSGYMPGAQHKPYILNEIDGVGALSDIFGERGVPARRQPRRAGW